MTVVAVHPHDEVKDGIPILALPRVPRWQRFYLDLLLVPITAYAYYQLNERGTLAMLVRDPWWV